MKEIPKDKTKVSESLNEKALQHVDCYIHNHIGLFIPTTGCKLNSIKSVYTNRDTYMIIITFDDSDMQGLLSQKEYQSCVVRKDQYLAAIQSPGIPYKEITDHFKRYYCLMIDKEYFEEQYLLYSDAIPTFEWELFCVCHDMLKSLNLFAFEYGKKMPNAKITLDAQETILTHWVIRSVLGENYDMRAISSDYEVARAQHYIEQHFGEKLSLQQLANLSNVSVSVLSRQFKKDMKMSVMDYLTLVRLEKATILLRRPERTVTEIALYCGFGSSAHFSDVFGKHYGKTPSQYRKNYKND